MKLKMKIYFLIIAGLLLISVDAFGGISTYTFTSNDHVGDTNDIYDLDHGKYYQWGIDWSIPEDETITAARLIFDNIYDTVWGFNFLHVHLLDDSPSGVFEGNEGPFRGWYDYFDSFWYGEEETKLFTKTHIPYGKKNA
ncbi:MAG: hypothetical protein PVG39_25645, partial [Desulfobacteraceae bacterium]